MVARWAANLLGSLTLLLSIMPGPSLVGAESAPVPSTVFFAETGQTVRDGMFRAWLDAGQVQLLGLPITGELVQGGRLVQYFERARLEMGIDDDGQPVGQVNRGALGRELIATRPATLSAPVAPIVSNADHRYFPATGHTLNEAFKRFWERNGGLEAFGLPISEEVSELGHTVQYFERARFEYVPERLGDDNDVALGRIGHEVASVLGLSLAPLPRPELATTWTATLADEIRAHSQSSQRIAALAAVTSIAPIEVQVTVPVAGTSWAPSLTATDAGPIYRGHIYLVDGWIDGEAIDGEARWYRLALDGSFVSAAYVRPFVTPAPPRTWAGRWIDVNLSTFILTVYDGTTPVRSALIIAGRKDRTPTGVFSIFKRVEAEVMDSSTVGFPPGHPEYYLIKNVAYTQYFTGAGHAIHGNYWVHPSRFGQFLSNGCIGLRNHDATWVWNLTRHGSIVNIHY